MNTGQEAKIYLSIHVIHYPCQTAEQTWDFLIFLKILFLKSKRNSSEICMLEILCVFHLFLFRVVPLSVCLSEFRIPIALLKRSTTNKKNTMRKKNDGHLKCFLHLPTWYHLNTKVPLYKFARVVILFFSVHQIRVDFKNLRFQILDLGSHFTHLLMVTDNCMCGFFITY